MKNNSVKCTYIVKPHADASSIQLICSGAYEKIQLDEAGNFNAILKTGIINESKPESFQVGKSIASNFVLKGNKISFSLAKYDENKTLEIDPLFVFRSTYLGGSSEDRAIKVHCTDLTMAWTIGNTYSNNFPTQNAYDNSFNSTSDDDVFLTRMNMNNHTLYFSTYIGGNKQDYPFDFDIRKIDNTIVICGQTASSDFPTVNALDNSLGGNMDGFILKLDSTGTTLDWSTYIGGSAADRMQGIRRDVMNDVCFGGFTQSTDLATSNAYDASFNGAVDGFVGKLFGNGQSLEFMSYIGGSGFDEVNSVDYTKVVVGGINVAYLGRTMSNNMPTVSPLYSTNSGGGGDAMIGIMKPNSLEYSTYYGGSGIERPTCLKIPHPTNTSLDTLFYCTGIVNSTNFPTVNAVQNSLAGGDDAFVLKINPFNNIVNFATYFGSSSNDRVFDIAIHSSGQYHIVGTSEGTNWPTSNYWSATKVGGTSDVVLVGFYDNNAVKYSTYFGGVHNEEGYGIDAPDNANMVIFCGSTDSTNFPVYQPYDSTHNGNWDGFVTVLSIKGTTGIDPKIFQKNINFSCKNIGNKIYINSEEEVYSETQIEIYSGEGKLVESLKSFKEKDIVIDTENFACGVYFIHVINNGEQTAFKIFKN